MRSKIKTHIMIFMSLISFTNYSFSATTQAYNRAFGITKIVDLVYVCWDYGFHEKSDKKLADKIQLRAENFLKKKGISEEELNRAIDDAMAENKVFFDNASPRDMANKCNQNYEELFIIKDKMGINK